MATYVIGDIHGNVTSFLQCLKQCEFDYQRDTLIQLGDVVDGGEFVYECIEELLKIKNLIAIRGNHEAWLLEFLKSSFHPAQWASGAISTAKSYALHSSKQLIYKYNGYGFKVSLNPNDIPLHHQVFFEKQLLYYIDQNNNLFIHGGFSRFQPLKDQRPEVFYWDRTLWQEALHWQIKKRYEGEVEPFYVAENFTNIFIGHSTTLTWGLNTPLKAAHIYNLDTGSGKNGRLTIMDVHTKKFWQSD
jgi:serine/threonine protein phosphatase 1